MLKLFVKNNINPLERGCFTSKNKSDEIDLNIIIILIQQMVYKKIRFWKFSTDIKLIVISEPLDLLVQSKMTYKAKETNVSYHTQVYYMPAGLQCYKQIFSLTCEMF